MKTIQMLKDRIKNFDYQIRQLEGERDEIIENLQRTVLKIKEYQDDINEMQIAVEKLEKAE